MLRPAGAVPGEDLSALLLGSKDLAVSRTTSQVRQRVGRVSDFTVCGLARDAGCTLPMLLLAGDDSCWTSERAARLRVALLWQPNSSRRVARTLLGMLSRRRRRHEASPPRALS